MDRQKTAPLSEQTSIKVSFAGGGVGGVGGVHQLSPAHWKAEKHRLPGATAPHGGKRAAAKERAAPPWIAKKPRR